MIEKLDSEMKKSFLEKNKITHAFSFKEDGLFVLYLGDGELNGFREKEFKRLNDLILFVKTHCKDLIFYRGN